MIDAVFNGNSLGVGVESSLLELLIPNPKLRRGITLCGSDGEPIAPIEWYN